MNFAISHTVRVALFALAISVCGHSASALASSSDQTDAQVATLVIAQASKPATAPPPPPPTTRNAPTTKPQVPTEDYAALVYVLMQTSMGDIVIELNHEKAPVTVNNFLSYAEKKYYNGTIFHRVIRGFMIQGGGFTQDMRRKPVDNPIENEWQNGLKNVYGSIAMARIGRQPDSATSQFFINVNDNKSLDVPRDGAGYAVFGTVVAGMKIVRQIESSVTSTQGSYRDVPAETITIENVMRMTDDDARMRIEQEKKATTTRESGTQ